MTYGNVAPAPFNFNCARAGITAIPSTAAAAMMMFSFLM
jgi:hypothetical protein